MDLAKPQATRTPAAFAKTPAVILIVIGWAALIAASFLPLLSAVQAIGLGLGALVTVRIVQHWRRSA